MSNINHFMTTGALTLPIAIWFLDCLFSTCRVKGNSMEPTLKDGDVLLVRKSDIFANYGFTQSKDEADRARIKRIEATMNANPDHPIMSTPPLVLPGNIVVFLSPHTAFPHEYRVKRVIGVGGQMVCKIISDS